MANGSDRNTGSGSTGWSIHPSLWFDSLCLIPLLADMGFYTSRHLQDSHVWQCRVATADPEVRGALAVLRDEIAVAAGKPLPAFLSLWCSPAAPAGDLRQPSAEAELDALIEAVGESEVLPRLMWQRSAHWSVEDEALFRSTRPALLIVLRWLRDVGLAHWWAENAVNSLEQRCRTLAAEVCGYELLPLIECRTGIELQASVVEVCLLRWAAPHAIRVTGVRFLTDVRYPATIILNNSVHELLHPPWPDGHPVSSQLADLAGDSFLAKAFARRPSEAGYNDWKGYVEENAAQALDQWLNGELGLAKDPIRRWIEADGGMHVLALLLFDLLRRGDFGSTDETFADFISRALTDGTAWPVDLRSRYQALIGE